MIQHFSRLCQVFSELFFEEDRSVRRNPLFCLHLLSLIAIRNYKSRIKYCLDLKSNPVKPDNFIRKDYKFERAKLFFATANILVSKFRH